MVYLVVFFFVVFFLMLTLMLTNPGRGNYYFKEFSEMLIYQDDLSISEMRNERREWEKIERQTILSRFKILK
jgi:hypothetical protein